MTILAWYIDMNDIEPPPKKKQKNIAYWYQMYMGGIKENIIPVQHWYILTSANDRGGTLTYRWSLSLSFDWDYAYPG